MHDFLKQCQQNNIIPTGLRITTQSHAFLGDLTGVDKIFDDTLRETEERLMLILTTHYENAISILEQEVEILNTTMQPLIERMSPAEKEIHTTIITRTKDNIKRKASLSEEKSKKKIKKT